MNMNEARHFTVDGLRGTLRHDVDMSRHVTWRAGGRADRVYQPADLADLLVFLRTLPAEEPVVAVGLGSNLLVRDGGLRGTVLLLHAALAELRIEPDGTLSPQGGGRGCKAADNKVRQSETSQRLDGVDTAATTTLYVQAGVPGAKLARFAARHNLGGAEFFAGIPGTLGGMLAMNAGCYGSETWGVVARVQTVTRTGVLHERVPAEYDIAYRHVARIKDAGHGVRDTGIESPLPLAGEGPGERVSPEPRILNPESPEFFVAAWLRLPAGDGEIARQQIKALLNKRIASQPLNLPNAGSVFRNPPGDHAARLIEQCGLKGRQIGGAQVSKKHANFIVNAGGATAADIENLINEVQAVVWQQTGIELRPEVRIIGEVA